MRPRIINHRYLEGLDTEKFFTDSNGTLLFDYEWVVAIARSTGLKSKKRRHIVKRFRIIMAYAITDLLERYETN